MKKGAWLLILLCCFALIPREGISQDCVPTSKANNINPDQLCSPVEVVTWIVTYRGIEANGDPVRIHFDWDDGNTEFIAASEIAPDTFEATGTHTYVSMDEKCNFRPVATLEVDGQLCTSQSQEQIVTIWDVDDKNGAYVNPSPGVYPVCIGNGARVIFDDNSKFNCVPSQENDNPNESTRWIQWVYGTRNTMSSDTLVTIETGSGDYSGPWPFTSPVITMPGPSWGSDEVSLPIRVASDNQIGEEFEIELRYWNYCNKYTDGEDPVVEDAVIRIVRLPDPTIHDVAPMCEFGSNIFLTAETGGGTWSGPGIVDGATGEFAPSVSGPGDHIIQYDVTDGNNCSATDTAIVQVLAAPDGTITPVPPFCLDDSPFTMQAATTQGTWSGTGIDHATGVFSPGIAGLGAHQITFTTDTDPSGCFGTDTVTVYVVAPPFAEFITSDSAWCQQATNNSLGEIVFTGTDSSTFDIHYTENSVEKSLTNLPRDTFLLLLNNVPGINTYILTRVVEHHGGNSCETDLADTLVMTVNPIPVATVTASYDDLCSPVEVEFNAEPGYKKYTWDFGTGIIETTNPSITRTFTFDYLDHLVISGSDTIFSQDDSTYMATLLVETFDGCIDSVTEEVTVYPVPDAGFHVFPEVQNHPDSIIYVTNMTSPGNWEYIWDYGDGNQDSVKDPVEHSYTNYGVYDIELKAFSPHCRDSISKRIQILPPPPVSKFRPDTVGCPPLVVAFRNESQFADSYVWDFDDGTFSTEQEPTHLFFQNKEHYVTLAAVGLSGTDSTTRIVYVHDPPQADFNVYPTESSNLKQVFKFTNNSHNASYYLWDFGDGNTSPNDEPAHIYSDSGSYTVTLYAWSDDDCVDTIVKHNVIKVIAGEGEVYFPNAFVWNGSGPSGGHWKEGEIDNSVFHPMVINAVEYRMIVYTRWGEKVFETNEIYVGWDGYLDSGELATEGVYVWKAWVTYVDGTEKEYRGDITFLH